MTGRSTAVGVALAATLLASCSGSEDGPSDGTGAGSADTTATAAPTEIASPSTATSAALPLKSASPAETVRTVLTAIAESDADTACSMQTERYIRKAIELSIQSSGLEPGASCRDMVVLASSLYESFGLDPAAAKYEVTAESGDKASVHVDYGAELSAVTLVLVRSNGAWLLDEEIQDNRAAVA